MRCKILRLRTESFKAVRTICARALSELFWSESLPPISVTRGGCRYALSKRRLAKHGVTLVSMTQDFGEGPPAEFAETVISAAAALHSAENAKHVTRTMLENARQGFWNGAHPPFGYRTIEAERRGQRIKKWWEIEPRAAEIVRLMFRLFLEGDGSAGPMGVKAIAAWLNSRGFATDRASRSMSGRFTACSRARAIPALTTTIAMTAERTSRARRKNGLPSQYRKSSRRQNFN